MIFDGTSISLRPSHLVRLLETSLPRCGVPMVITRRIDGFGSKKNVSAKPSRTSGSAFSSANGLSAERFPELVAAVDRLQLGHQSAHAVADEHHLVERRIAALGIERDSHVGQVLAHLRGAVPERLAGRIQVEPELVVLGGSPGRCAGR